MEKVEQMKILEKDLIGIAEEVERLRAELLNAETRASGTCFSLCIQDPTPFFLTILLPLTAQCMHLCSSGLIHHSVHEPR